MQKLIFVTFNDIGSLHYGGALCSYRNYQSLSQFYQIETVVIKKHSTFKSLQSCLEGNYPPILNSNISKIISSILKNNIEIVFLDSSLMGKLSNAIKKRTNAKIIVFFNNVEYDYTLVRFGIEFSIQKIIYQRLAFKNEKKSIINSDYRISLTERDRNRIFELYHKQIDCVIPVTLPDKRYNFNFNNIGKYCLLFGANTRANYEGYKWFVQNVAEKIKSDIVIAGKGFDKIANEFERDNVQVIGFVEDLEELYANAICIIIPLLSGSGMKLKTVEALMYGKTIFGSAEAFEGYDFDYSQVGGLCNTAEDYISQINDYLLNSTTINNYSRSIYEKKYCDSVVSNDFRIF